MRRDTLTSFFRQAVAAALPLAAACTSSGGGFCGNRPDPQTVHVDGGFATQTSSSIAISAPFRSIPTVSSQLSWDIAHFVEPQLSREERASLARLRDDALTALEVEAHALPPAWSVAMGLPSARVTAMLVLSLRDEVARRTRAIA
jgi:hypothetical protein